MDTMGRGPTKQAWEMFTLNLISGFIFLKFPKFLDFRQFQAFSLISGFFEFRFRNCLCLTCKSLWQLYEACPYIYTCRYIWWENLIRSDNGIRIKLTKKTLKNLKKPLKMPLKNPEKSFSF